MLDFYLIPENEETPEYPDESSYIGSIDWEQHEALNTYFDAFKKQPLLHFYEDQRFIVSEVNELLSYRPNNNYVKKKNGKETIEEFHIILSQAANKKMSLITFCD